MEERLQEALAELEDLALFQEGKIQAEQLR